MGRKPNEIEDWGKSAQMVGERERDGSVYCPTPDEIAAKCREIREGWGLKQWNKQGPPGPVEMPAVRDDRHYGRT